MYFENVPYKALYSGKNGVWSGSQTNVPAYACFGSRTQAVAHVRRLRATFVILFPKIDFCSFKSLYFPF